MAGPVKLNSIIAVALIAALLIDVERKAVAAVVAYDDFESYTPGSLLLGQGGGTGWTTNWNSRSTSTMSAVAGIIPGHGTSFLTEPTSSTSWNSAGERGFTPQTGTTYVGVFFTTNADWATDFFQLYFNGTTYDDVNGNIVGNQTVCHTVGVLNAAAPSPFFARKGGPSTDITTITSSLTYTGGTVHQLIAKLAKSTGVGTDNYDQITLWVDPTSEGDTPAAAALDPLEPGTTRMGPTFSNFHIRLASVEIGVDKLYLDNLAIATTFAEALHGPSVAHPGDFDGDGDVDGADFVAWQTNFPKASGALLTDGDADGDGDVDGADFVVWQTNFPYTPGPGITTVPEPAAGWLFVVEVALGAVFIRRSDSFQRG